MNRNYSLDCLRALAIMMVFTAHTVLSYGSNSTIISPLQFGGTGVDLFFVLSGWLIGSQLFDEQRKYANIDLKRFWLRRWMRTFPAYYAVLIFTVIQIYLTKDNVEFPVRYLFFLQNYQESIPFFTVSWSLCVEEQFYLLIAPFVIVLSKIPRNGKIAMLMILLLLPTVFRAFGLYESTWQTHVRWDCCVMGVTLAFLKNHLGPIWNILKSHCKTLAFVALLVYLFFYVSRWNPDWNIKDPSPLGLAFIFAMWVIWADTKPVQLTGILYTVVIFISTRSYSLYLLHPDALAVSKRLVPDQNFLAYYAFSLALALIVSEILYKLIELPFMNSRKNFRASCSRSQVASFKSQQTASGLSRK